MSATASGPCTGPETGDAAAKVLPPYAGLLTGETASLARPRAKTARRARGSRIAPGQHEIPGLGILDILLREADDIYAEAVAEAERDGHRLAATVVMFSGGNDSITAAHLFRDRADYAGMSNTGVGVEETRQFVRDTCAGWGLPLIEKHPRPGRTYRDLVLGLALSGQGPNKGRPVNIGFPGHLGHAVMYHWLKERPFQDMRNDLVTGPLDRVIYISGIRKPESRKRRKKSQAVERNGSIVWCKPLLNWTKIDLNSYRRRFGDVPRNEVADTLHMSGECMCGAHAQPGELDEYAYWYPGAVEPIRDLEAEARALGIKRCTWGGGTGTPCEGVCNL